MIRETRSADDIAVVARHFPQFLSGNEVKDDCRYFVAEQGGEIVGLIMFDHIEDDVWRGHFMMIRPGKGVIYARQAIRKMLESGACRILGMTPIDNHKALRAAFAAGMRYVRKSDQFHITECP